LAAPDIEDMLEAVHGRIRTFTGRPDPDPAQEEDALISPRDILIDGDTAASVNYSTRTLTDWQAFRVRSGSVWCRPELWIMMFRLLLLAFAISIVTVLVVPDPASLKASKFTAISKFLNIIVGWMVGIHLSTSVTRWFDCVNGYLELMDAIRNLQMQFYALGLPDHLANPVIRQGYASGWLIYQSCLLETKVNVDKKSHHSDRSIEVIEMWKVLSAKQVGVLGSDEEETVPLLMAHEMAALKKARDPPALIWMWVGCLIARYAQDKWLPAMESPVYGRIMNIVQDAYTAIRDVRTSCSVQSALVYTHFMATIVHIQNILNAVCLGLVGGIGIGTWMVRRGYHIYEPEAHTSRQDFHQDFQNIAVTVMYCCLGPIMFQGLLLICMDVSQPFDSKASAIPVDHLLIQLEHDLKDCRHMIDHLPCERPYFKKAPPRPSLKSLRPDTPAHPVFTGSSGTAADAMV